MRKLTRTILSGWRIGTEGCRQLQYVATYHDGQQQMIEAEDLETANQKAAEEAVKRGTTVQGVAEGTK